MAFVNSTLTLKRLGPIHQLDGLGLVYFQYTIEFYTYLYLFPLVGSMTKVKKSNTGTPNQHLQARVLYLYRAANYLANIQDDRETLESTAAVSSKSGNIKVKQVSLQDTEQPMIDTDISEPVPPEDVAQDCVISYSKMDCRLEAAGSSRHLLSHLRSVSLKSQIRLSPAMKRSICKRCDAILIAGRTSSSCMENKSRNRNKPWADVLVVTCNSCATAKRYPVGAKRQSRKGQRANLSTPKTAKETG